jgi:hypothetical protein
MQKYRVDLFDIDEAERHTRETVFTNTIHQMDPDMVAWQAPLMRAIAHTNFVRVISLSEPPEGYNGPSRSKYGTRLFYDMIGEPHNIMITNYLFDYLTFAIDEMAEVNWIIYDATQTATARETGERKSRTVKKSWIDDFKHGAVSIITDRLEAQFKADTDTNPHTTAMVVFNTKALSNAVSARYPYLVSLRERTHTIRTAGFAHGQRYGKEADINRRGVSTRGGPAGYLN